MDRRVLKKITAHKQDVIQQAYLGTIVRNLEFVLVSDKIERIQACGAMLERYKSRALIYH
jgi:hypothetical protein